MSETEKKRDRNVDWKTERERQLKRNLCIGAAAGAAVFVLLVIVMKSVVKDRSEKAPVLSAGEGSIVEASGDLILPGLSEAESEVASIVESIAEEPEPTPEPVLIRIDDVEEKAADMSVDWNLVLVNPKRVLSRDFWTDTTDIGCSDDDYHVFDYRAQEALDQMIYDCEEQTGAGPYIRSAWRSWGDQEGLLENKIQDYYDEGCNEEEAYENAKEWVALPGTSEHQLGLAVDVASEGYHILNSEQEESPVHQWLTTHCQEYGFILRYPNGKSEYTGIVYEPWHYRYVGVEAATEIMSRGICLEEYLAEKGMYP